MNEKIKNPAAVTLGTLGGKKKSEAKTLAVRKNGRKGGRPKKDKVCGWCKKPLINEGGRKFHKTCPDILK